MIKKMENFSASSLVRFFFFLYASEELSCFSSADFETDKRVEEEKARASPIFKASYYTLEGWGGSFQKL